MRRSKKESYVFLTLSILIFAMLGYKIYNKVNNPPEERCWMIKSIGTCRSTGMCGVVYDDGSKGLVYNPVIGDWICGEE